MRKTFQVITQLAFLSLFVALTLLNRIQLWMGIFIVLGIIGTLIFNRFYCGWLCPINTGIKGVNWLKRVLKIGSLKIPAFLKKPVIRYLVLGAFLAMMAATIATGKKLPVLPALVGIGVFLSFFFHESLWHRYLCPYGTLLSFPGRLSKKPIKIDRTCVSCGSCQAVCPSEAIIQRDDQYNIIEHECLVCMECVTVCPKDSIS